MGQLFDRVTLLYKGRQIFFGKASEAVSYFENLGFERTSFPVRPSAAEDPLHLG